MDRHIQTIKSGYSNHRFLQIGETEGRLHLMVTETPYPECSGGVMLGPAEESELLSLLITRRVEASGILEADGIEEDHLTAVEA